MAARAVVGRPGMGAAWFGHCDLSGRPVRAPCMATARDGPRVRDAPWEGLLWVGRGWSRQAAWHGNAHGMTEGPQTADFGRVGSVHCLSGLSRCGTLAGLTWASWCGDALIGIRHFLSVAA